MLDLLLDTDSHDLVISDAGVMQTVADAPLVAQKVEIRLKTQTGEWLYDLSMGIDYLGRVLVKAPDLRLVRSLFVAEIDTVDEVTAIRSLTLDVTGRTFAVAFTAETTEGAIAGTV